MEERGTDKMSEGESVDQLMHEAEQKFREGVKVLNSWGVQAKELIQRQPGAVLVGVAVLGFVTGMLLRRAASGERR